MSASTIHIGFGPSSSGPTYIDTCYDGDLYVNVRGLPKADARELVETTHRVCPH